MVLPVVVAIAMAATFVVAERPAAAQAGQAAPSGPLIPELEGLAGLLGTWEVEATWSSGTALWGRAEYHAILGGRFVASSTWVRDGDGPVYLRYEAVFGPGDEPGTVDSYVFDRAGTMTRSVMRLAEDDAGRAWHMQWPAGDRMILERLAAPASGAGESDWDVWMGGPGSGEAGAAPVAEADRELLLDATWKRVPPRRPFRFEAAPRSAALAPVSALAGSWAIDTTWPDGRPLRAWLRVDDWVHGTILHGTTVDQAADGTTAMRYRSFFIPARDGAPGVVEEVRFARTGAVTVACVTDVDGTVTATLDPPDAEAAARVKRFTPIDADRLEWTIHDVAAEVADPASHAAGAEGSQLVASGTWERMTAAPSREEANMAANIRTELFVGRGPDPTRFTCTERIDAPVADVWATFTDGAMFKQVYGPDRDTLRADIELEIGGRYEWLWDGVTGSNDCQVLSYIPERMISFSWNAPPSQPESRDLRTWVVIEFASLGEPPQYAAGNALVLERPRPATQITLTHLGFGDAPHWAETKAYFEQAWPSVLTLVKARLEAPDAR